LISRQEVDQYKQDVRLNSSFFNRRKASPSFRGPVPAQQNQNQNQNESVNDRIKKAIERNRNKEGRKNFTGVVPSDRSPSVQTRTSSGFTSYAGKEKQSEMFEPKSQTNKSEFLASRLEKFKQNKQGANNLPPFPPPVKREVNQESLKERLLRKRAAEKNTGMGYRKSTLPRPKLKDTARKKSSFSGPSIFDRLWSRVDQDFWKKWIMRLGWAFCLVLCLRFVFMDRGVVDYYKMESWLGQREQQLSQIRHENQELILEIAKIKKDKSYQKKLARDLLGLISKDEYLIIFAKQDESLPTQI